MGVIFGAQSRLWPSSWAPGIWAHPGTPSGTRVPPTPFPPAPPPRACWRRGSPTPPFTVQSPNMPTRCAWRSQGDSSWHGVRSPDPGQCHGGLGVPQANLPQERGTAKPGALHQPLPAPHSLGCLFLCAHPGLALPATPQPPLRSPGGLPCWPQGERAPKTPLGGPAPNTERVKIRQTRRGSEQAAFSGFSFFMYKKK